MAAVLTVAAACAPATNSSLLPASLVSRGRRADAGRAGLVFYEEDVRSVVAAIASRNVSNDVGHRQHTMVRGATRETSVSLLLDPVIAGRGVSCGPRPRGRSGIVRETCRAIHERDA